MNTENRISIGKINGAEIFAVAGPDGETFVPIKPICEAIGVDYEAQYKKVGSHHILGSTISLKEIVAADGKTREMVCLPVKFVYGWIFTINPRNVSDDARENVVKYQTECYDILYQHFSGRSGKMKELDDAERKSVAKIEKLDEAIKTAQGIVSNLKAEKSGENDRLNKIRAARLDDSPSLFD